MEQLLHWDAQALLWINGHHTPFLDWFMWYATQSWVWIPLYLLMVFAVYKMATSLEFNHSLEYERQDHMRTATEIEKLSGGKKEKTDAKHRGWYIFLLVLLGVACIALAAGLSDYVTSGILKKMICRPRPTHSGLAKYLHLVHGYTGGQYGFPSSHAANTFAVATCFMRVMRCLRNRPHEAVVRRIQDVWAVRALFTAMTVLLVIYVGLNCYSRMYLGVHYPLDILCGGAIGMLFGWLFGLLYDYVVRPICGKQVRYIRVW